MKTTSYAFLIAVQLLVGCSQSWAQSCAQVIAGPVQPSRPLVAVELPDSVASIPLVREGNRIIHEGYIAIAKDINAEVRSNFAIVLAYQDFFEPGSNSVTVVSLRDRAALLSAIYRQPVIHWESWGGYRLIQAHESSGDEFKRVFPYLMENIMHLNKDLQKTLFYFDITGVTKSSPKNMTAHEARVFFSRPDFLKRTQFYRNRLPIDTEAARLVLQNAGWLP
jgi:hypothetical protein